MAERVTRAEAEPQALKQTPCGLCRVLRGSPCGDAGADGGTRTRDLFLTKKVLYLLSHSSKFAVYITLFLQVRFRREPKVQNFSLSLPFRTVFVAMPSPRKKTRPRSAVLFGADGGTRTRDLFLTKEVLYLLSYISVSMILTVCGDLRLPAFLPLAGVTKEVLYLLSYISMADDAAFRAGSRRRMLYDYMFSPRLCQRNSGSRPRFFGGRGE